ncbi:hypothetical protein Chor_009664 [Crotalus horridus]
MGAALLEMLVTLTFLALRVTYYHERLTRVNWPCLVFSLILIGIFCLDAYKTYQAEMGSEEGEQVKLICRIRARFALAGRADETAGLGRSQNQIERLDGRPPGDAWTGGCIEK